MSKVCEPVCQHSTKPWLQQLQDLTPPSRVDWHWTVSNITAMFPGVPCTERQPSCKVLWLPWCCVWPLPGHAAPSSPDQRRPAAAGSGSLRILSFRFLTSSSPVPLPNSHGGRTGPSFFSRTAPRAKPPLSVTAFTLPRVKFYEAAGCCVGL